MSVPVPKRGGRVASLSSIRSTALRIIAMNIVVPLTTELSLLQRRGGARKPLSHGAGMYMYYVGSPAI